MGKTPAQVVRDIPLRFWAKVNKTPTCWLWTAHRHYRTGYGSFARGGQYGGHVGAHRFSWELHNGPIPKGLSVLHKCDVPACVNPNHLFLGTQVDNLKDMVAKNRHAKGQPSSLTPERVRQLRKDYAADADPGRVRRVATKYNVSLSSIRRIVANEVWKWV